MTNEKEGPQLSSIEGGKGDETVTDEKIVASLTALFQTLVREDKVTRDNIIKVGTQIVHMLNDVTDRADALQARVEVLEGCCRKAVQELAPGLASK